MAIQFNCYQIQTDRAKCVEYRFQSAGQERDKKKSHRQGRKEEEANPTGPTLAMCSYLMLGFSAPLCCVLSALDCRRYTDKWMACRRCRSPV